MKGKTDTVPSQGWAARVPQGNAGIVGQLRNEPELLVCGDETYCWIRHESLTTSLSDTLARRLRLEVGAELFQVDSQGQIRPWGKRVPSGLLPTSEWFSLTKAFVPQVPPTRYGAPRSVPHPLRLVPSDVVVNSTFIRCALTQWDHFVRTAPSLRLTRWNFAAATTQDVLVRGTPLPTLSGQHYWESSRLIVPCGWKWSPTLSAEVVRRVLRLKTGDWAIACEQTSTWNIIFDEAFVPARRQNVRLTVQELSAGGASS